MLKKETQNIIILQFYICFIIVLKIADIPKLRIMFQIRVFKM